jgi:hypothetical protein
MSRLIVDVPIKPPSATMYLLFKWFSSTVHLNKERLNSYHTSYLREITVTFIASYRDKFHNQNCGKRLVD